MLADFQAVAELGWIAGCGVLLCAFACFTVLPALLMLFDRRGTLRVPAKPVDTSCRSPHAAVRRDDLAARPGAPARRWSLAGGAAC